APALGMLCLEVKAHRRIVRETDGRWRLGSDPPVSRSPFKQANDNMHSLLDLLRQRRPNDVGSLVYWSAVVFTRCDFRVPAIEWNEWEVIDRRDLHGAPISVLVSRILERARDELPFKVAKERPTSQQCAAISRALRPRFEVLQTPLQRREEQEEEIRAFTEE